MADSSDKVLALVEAELKKNPGASTEELQNAAKKKYPSAGKLSKRQFNARYALQIKRRKPGAGQKKSTTSATKAPAKRRTGRAAAAVKRVASRAPRSRSAATTPAPAGIDRDAVRAQFLRFASELTGAESRGDLVRVLASVDKYVDAVGKAVR